MRMSLALVMCLMAVLSGSPADAQQAPLDIEVASLLSRLQSMGHGYYSEQEWADIDAQIDHMAAQAEQGRLWDTLVEVYLIKAMVLSDMRHQDQPALALLEQTRQKYGDLAPRQMGKVYVRQAEVYSKMGDDAAIAQLIRDFRKSKFYDPESYTYTGGDGPKDPIAITRPAGRGDDSVSVSAMEMYRNRARFAKGRLFPDFQTTDTAGRPVRLSDYRGKVVLVDFYLTGWAPWKQGLEYLVSTYSRYNPHGFEIIGVNLERDPVGLDEFLRANKVTWPQVVNDRKLPASVGVFGEAASFLVGPNGEILGRDLSGAELINALKSALSVQM